MTARLLRLAGLLLFSIAFALPAVRVASSDAPAITEPGWFCAMVATAATGSLVHHVDGGPFSGDAGFSIPLILSGWANPLFLLSLALSFWTKTLPVRRVLDALVLLCFVATWIFFVRVHIVPLIGHVFWVLGPLAALTPDILGRWIDRRPVLPPSEF